MAKIKHETIKFKVEIDGKVEAIGIFKEILQRHHLKIETSSEGLDESDFGLVVLNMLVSGKKTDIKQFKEALYLFTGQ